LAAALLLAAGLSGGSASANSNTAKPAGSPARGTSGCDIVGTQGRDTLTGHDGSDVICGLGGNDTIDGLGGDDTLKGGPGNDDISGGPGDDTFYGGLGSDTCRQDLGTGAINSCEWPNPLEMCPVPTGTVYDNFGDPRVGHTHQGDDILAKKGAKIFAPFGGKLEKGHSGDGGNEEFVYGDKGFVFNAHLSKTTKDRRVHTGDVIGFVGSTGNAGTTNHDHFEWHPDNKDAVDPFPYLKKVCNKTHRTPDARTEVALRTTL
jgi:murein DD-endopeptidase MepM/ murein hydrolase activator NlpD